jgi:quercetin dioxygenase-like cupin family protein
MEAAAASSGEFGEFDAEQPFPGVTRRTLQTQKATVAAYEFDPGASFPLHTHDQEQITLVEAGEIEFTAAGAVIRLAAGGWSVVQPGVEHGVTAGTAGARIVAIVVPPRAADGYSISES